MRDRVDIRTAETALGDDERCRTVLLGDLRRAIGGGVHDDDLAADAGFFKALVTPVDELTDREFLVEAGDDDRYERILLGTAP
jgi:hypothetical protein